MSKGSCPMKWRSTSLRYSQTVVSFAEDSGFADAGYPLISFYDAVS